MVTRSSTAVLIHSHSESGGTSRESTWQKVVSAYSKAIEIPVESHDSGRNIKDEPLGQIAAHPRLVHVAQGTYKGRATQQKEITCKPRIRREIQ